MKTRHLFFAALTAATALASCSEEDSMARKNEAPLQITTSIPSLTRAAISGTQLPEGAQIGVSVVNPDGSDYDGIALYKNVMYTKNTGWSTQTPITLSTTIGKAIAYYPYSNAVSDISAIPVETASQTDYLYSSWVNNISFDNPQANFTLNHALCAVQINLSNQSYTAGAGQVTKVAITSPALATTATLNAQTGKLSAFAGQDGSITSNETFTLTQEPHAVTIMGIPTGAQEAITVNMTIDGEEITTPATINSPIMQGKVYIINIKVNDVPLSTRVSSVDVQNIDK